MNNVEMLTPFNDKLANATMDFLVTETTQKISNKIENGDDVVKIITKLVDNLNYDVRLNLVTLSEVAELELPCSGYTCIWELLDSAVVELVIKKVEQNLGVSFG